MPWTKIDDQFYDHPKILQASDAGVALFIRALSYCSRYLTDGLVATVKVRHLVNTTRWQEAADSLVAAKLWDRVDGGYQVHDYLEYNPSAVQVKQERKAAAERKAEWRRRRAAEEEATRRASSPDGSPGGSPARTDASSPNSPMPDPNPVPPPLPKKDTSNGVPLEGAAPTLPNDPADLTIAQIKKLKLHKEEWENLGKIEAANRNRAGVMAIIKRKTHTTPPAIEVFREVTERYPLKAVGVAIADAVGEVPDDLEFWRQVVTAYVTNGWNRTNAGNMLGYYRRREIPAIGSAPAAASRGQPSQILRKGPLVDPRTPEQIDELRQHMIKHRQQLEEEAAQKAAANA